MILKKEITLQKVGKKKKKKKEKREYLNGFNAAGPKNAVLVDWNSTIMGLNS